MENFWAVSLLIIESFVFVAYLIVLFHIVSDLFRSHEVGGFGKALHDAGTITAQEFAQLKAKALA